MRTHRLTREQLVPRPLDEVFEFFSDARKLERLTPPWLHFEVITPAVEMRAGTTIDYRLRLHGVPIRWQSEITVWQPPYRFVDRQRKGPYSLWVHTHRFEELSGGTLVTDVVDYAVPGAGLPGGDLVRRWFVGPDLEKIFDFRAQQLNAWVLEKAREPQHYPVQSLIEAGR